MASSGTSVAITGGSPPELRVSLVEVGQMFASTDDLRLAAERSFMKDARGMKADKRVGGGKSKLYRCAGAEWDPKRKGKGSAQLTAGCQALVRAYQLKTGEWRVTQVSLEHVSCAGGTKNASWRAFEEEATSIINANRSITISSLQDTLQAQIGSLRMSDRTAYRLRDRILGKDDTESRETYQMLDSFLQYVRDNSGGSVTDCQVFSLDATRLQGSWNGVMLTLSFKDANNNIFHVATAICRKENAESYTYLLENAKKFEPLGAVLNRETMTCFADGHKGSEVGLFASCPLTEDRRCLEHMLSSIPDVGEAGNMLCYEMSKAPTERLFRTKMNELKSTRPAAVEALEKFPHRLWANYADRGNITWNQAATNFSKSTNNTLGAQSRGKPMLPLLMDMLLKTASRLDAAANQQGHDLQLVPFAQVTYDREFMLASDYHVTSCGQGIYSVGDKDTGMALYGNRVSFNPARIHDVSCTCGFRKRWCIPCRHMLAVAKYLPGDNDWTLDIIHDGFRLGRYRTAAADPRYRVIPPVWDDLSSNPNHLPPCRVDTQAGRTKGGCRTKRKASNGEYSTLSSYNTVRLRPAPPGDQDPSLGSLAAASQGPSAQAASVVDRGP